MDADASSYAAPLPASTRPKERIGFFAHHGIWSPGVRLFRNIHFLGKATIISAVFVLVLMQSMWLFVGSALHSINLDKTERQGLSAQRELMLALTQSLEMRGAIAAGKTDVSAALNSFNEKLASIQKAGAPTMDLSEPLKFVHQGAEPLKQVSGDTDEAYAQADGLVQQVLRAAVSVSDQSGLSTDSDPVAYSLMLAATQEALQLGAAIGRVADLGAQAQTNGEATPVARRIVQGETYVLYKQIERLFGRFEAIVKEEPALQPTLEFQQAFDPINAFMRQSRKALPADGASPTDGAPLQAAGAAATARMLELTQRSLQALDARVQQRIAAQQQKLLLQIGFVAAALVVAWYLFHCFYLVTRGGMSELKRHIDCMAAGDLKTHPRAWGRDEAANVLAAMEAMQNSLRTLVGQVRSCAGAIVTQSTQMSEGAHELSQRTDASATRLQQSAASMESIAKLANDSAGEVSRSAELGRTASVKASESQQRIFELVDRIERLHASAKKVGDIVGVIDSIAFQTNILALNAAVEAARAGDQGRGFAVVASEVRALAQRSATAAREIKTLVQQSSEDTSSGTQAVHVAGEAIRELATEVKGIGGTLERAAAANANQVREVAAVAASISALDRDSQQNAAMVERTSAAAMDMRTKADELAAATQRFLL